MSDLKQIYEDNIKMFDDLDIAVRDWMPVPDILVRDGKENGIIIVPQRDGSYEVTYIFTIYPKDPYLRGVKNPCNVIGASYIFSAKYVDKTVSGCKDIIRNLENYNGVRALKVYHVVGNVGNDEIADYREDLPQSLLDMHKYRSNSGKFYSQVKRDLSDMIT